MARMRMRMDAAGRPARLGSVSLAGRLSAGRSNGATDEAAAEADPTRPRRRPLGRQSKQLEARPAATRPEQTGCRSGRRRPGREWTFSALRLGARVGKLSLKCAIESNRIESSRARPGRIAAQLVADSSHLSIARVGSERVGPAEVQVDLRLESRKPLRRPLPEVSK